MTSAVAAIVILKEEELVEHMRRASAVSPEQAQSLSALRLDRSFALDHLTRRDVIRTTASGEYWLDDAAWEAFQDARRGSARIILGAVVALAGIAFYLITSSSAK